jgi:ribose transport system permease protein
MSTESPPRPGEQPPPQPAPPDPTLPPKQSERSFVLSTSRGPVALVAGAFRITERYALAVLLVAVVAFFSLWPKTAHIYIQPDNIRNIVGSQTVLAIIALGSIVPLVCGQFDLSVGSVAGLCSVLSASMFARFHMPLVAGIAVGILAGALIGVVNGLLVTTFGVNALITTLGTSSVVIGVENWYTGGTSIIEGVPTALTTFGSKTWLGIPRLFYLLVLVAVVVWYLLEHTPFGRYLHAVGINAEAAQLVGIHIPSLVRRSFIVSGSFAGLAGVVLLAQSGAGNPGIGANFTLTALAAAFLGATSVRPGRFNVVGTLLAIYFLNTAITGLTFAGVLSFINDLFTGAALVFAVALSTLLRRRGVRAGT